ncbi:MAG TPA: KEOPS complex kinase/ATPase Bud32 [Thermoplasmata archaeon]
MLLKRGAEAEIRRTEFLGRPAVEKHRVPKAYRLPELDEDLRRARIRMEVRLMAEARSAGVAVPVLYDVNFLDNKILMEFIDGPTVKDVLEEGGSKSHEVAKEIGRHAARLHRAGIVHGDLTTSNMILREGRIVMIDFSLGAKDEQTEARGVDLHLLREALTSAHRNAAAYYRDVLAGYREVLGSQANAVIRKVQEIESRGRYT